MKRNIWIMNHYAANMYFEKGGRHYFFAKYLAEKGYRVTVFCASTLHNTNRNLNTKGEKWIAKTLDDVTYVFVKTSGYKGNGIARVRNMTDFYINLFPASKAAANAGGKPDIILASSVHPLTLAAGLKIAKKMAVPCICEIRDLWPESIVTYGHFSPKNPLIVGLYRLERKIYKEADSLIFTMRGGQDYIKDKGWERGIDFRKIYYVNNGVDLKSFDYNREHFQIKDEDLDNKDTFKILYTGAIRKANHVETLIKAVEKIESSKKCCLLIYGDGDEKGNLEAYCKKHRLNNVKFKGKAEKKYIPYILSKSDLNVLNYQQADTVKYGGSQNKFFEYLASQKPVCANIKMGYSIINKYHCGLEENVRNEYEYAQMIEKFMSMEKTEYETYSKNARKAAEQYDFSILTDKIEKILESVIKKYERTIVKKN